MHLTLPESVHPHARGPGWVVVSAAGHTTLLILLFAAHARPSSAAAAPPEVVPIQFAALHRPEPTPRTALSTPAALPPRAPTVPSLPVPSVILPTLPEPSIRAPALDPSGHGIGSPIGFGDPGISPAPSLPSGGVFDASAVDRAVEPIRGNPTPQYPPALSSAGFEGSVTVRFVVDTLGTVERGSVTVIRSSHALLEQSVREALIRMRFLPAEARGRKVRQLVEQSFQFTIRR